MSADADLYDLIRQLKTELEWAVKTGITVEHRPPPPESAMAQPAIAVRGNELRAGDPRGPDPRGSEQRPPAARGNEQRAEARGPDPRSYEQRAEARGQPQRSTQSGPTGEMNPEGRQRTETALTQLGARATLAQIREVIGDCTRCKLHRQGRTQIVFGVGNPQAEVMFVGEGPGADEDRQGEPFVGKAGQLLTRIIESGMGMPRADVYIANVLKCRPPNNRDPEPDEVEQCEPFLRAQIRSIAPKVIITLGKHASHALLATSTPITRLRGRWSEYDGIPVMPTYHPAYLLRNPAEKRAVWEDIQEVLRKMGRPIPERGARD